MSDNSPDYERLACLADLEHRPEDSAALRAAAAQAREIAELRESFIASGCAIHETGTDVYVQNARAESSESANRALQSEVEGLRRAVAMKDAALSSNLEVIPSSAANVRHKVFEAIAYTGTETPSEETP